MKKWYAKIASVLFRSQLEGPPDNVELATTVMDRHVTPFTSIFTIGKELVHEVGKQEASLFEDASLPVLTEYDIFRG